MHFNRTQLGVISASSNELSDTCLLCLLFAQCATLNLSWLPWQHCQALGLEIDLIDTLFSSPSTSYKLLIAHTPRIAAPPPTQRWHKFDLFVETCLNFFTSGSFLFLSDCGLDASVLASSYQTRWMWDTDDPLKALWLEIKKKTSWNYSDWVHNVWQKSSQR